MSKSITKLLLLAMCSLPVATIAAVKGEGGAGATQPEHASLSNCQLLSASQFVGPSSCTYISAVDGLFANYGPPQPFLDTKEGQTYTAGGGAASSPSPTPVPTGAGTNDAAERLRQQQIDREQQARDQAIGGDTFQ